MDMMASTWQSSSLMERLQVVRCLKALVPVVQGRLLSPGERPMVSKSIASAELVNARLLDRAGVSWL